MAKSRSGDQVLDDIELLNMHRYPDTVSPATLAYVRNSRACQKRLEELLKNTPLKKSGGRVNIDRLIPSSPEPGLAPMEAPPEEGLEAPVPAYRPRPRENPGFFARILQKLSS